MRGRMGDNECKCVICKTCHGTGQVWIAFDKTYLGKNRLDDQDELEMCEDCEGTGLEDICDECQLRIDDERNGDFA